MIGMFARFWLSRATLGGAPLGSLEEAIAMDRRLEEAKSIDDQPPQEGAWNWLPGREAQDAALEEIFLELGRMARLVAGPHTRLPVIDQATLAVRQKGRAYSIQVDQGGFRLYFEPDVLRSSQEAVLRFLGGYETTLAEHHLAEEFLGQYLPLAEVHAVLAEPPRWRAKGRLAGVSCSQCEDALHAERIQPAVPTYQPEPDRVAARQAAREQAALAALKREARIAAYEANRS